MRRVAISGIGVLCPLGGSTEQIAANAIAGRSAIRRIEHPWSDRLIAPLAAEVDFNEAEHFSAPQTRMLDRVSQFALVAARRALADSGLEISRLGHERVGVFLGTGMGGMHSTDEAYQALYAERVDRLRPFIVLLAMTNAAAAWIGLEYGLTGPNLTYSTACSSSAVSVGEAWTRLRRGELDLAIAGGAEAPLSLGSMKAWEALRTLASEDPVDASRSCKPFAQNRSGLVLAEGAAIVVLEDWEHALARGARIHGELIGYGLTTDASHITRPTVDGQAAAMRAALQSANCTPAAIDSINAHGTGTQANDSVETAAIKQVFGARAYRIPVSATKAIHGHMLGATATLELVLSLISIRLRTLLPTMHLDRPAADCDLDYVANASRAVGELHTVMSNSFAFGGTNAVLVVRSAPAGEGAPPTD